MSHQQTPPNSTGYQTCPSCGRTLPANAPECLFCGRIFYIQRKSLRPQFCVHCGQPLTGSGKFCSNCGAAATGGTAAQKQRPSQQNQGQQPRPNQRQQVFVGELRKCPNCGAALSAFETNCPVCGVELHGVKASNVIQEFSSQLGQLKEDQRPSFITSFPIPNTKEDLLEFMILAASNIKTIADSDDRLNQAWSSKFEQAYQKAQIAVRDAPGFARFRDIYWTKKKEAEKALKKLKRKRRASTIALIISATLGIFGLFICTEGFLEGNPLEGVLGAISFVAEISCIAFMCILFDSSSNRAYP